MSKPASQPDDRLREAVGAQYELIRLLGVGGMGRVWLARDRTLERPVAIKVVADELAGNAVYRERFLREARTVARLRHPGIVAVHAAGEADGLLYFVMEFVEGESLRERIVREGRLTVADAVPIIADLARALAAAHAQGVVHRDVKPENVMLDAATGRAMLTDFGVAQAGAADGSGRMTSTGMVVGSPRYMSPEQAVGDRDLDGRSDLYALGLVAYEILSGSEPFEATSAGALLAKRLTSDPPPLAERAPDVPPLVAAVVTRALARERDDRWANGEAFATALEAALAGEDPDAAVAALGSEGAATTRPSQVRDWRTPRPAPRPGAAGRRWWRGWRGVAAVATLAAVLLVAASAWRRTSGAKDAHGRQTMLVLPFDLVGNDPELEWLREGAVGMLTLDLAHWRDLGVVDYARTLDLLRNAGLEASDRIGPTEAQRIARTARANAYVLGRIQRAGDSLTVVAGIYDAQRSTPYATFTESAAADADPRALFDRLARDLLQLSGAPEITPSLATSTTPSLRAYRDYLAGVAALNRWQLDSADRYFARAIERDSGFALAYYKRALAAGWQSMTDTLGVTYARLAVANAGRLLPRDRALVEAYLALSEGLNAAVNSERETASEQLRAAQQRYADIIALDSLDAEAWYGLGDAHFHAPAVGAALLESYQAALNAFDRTLALDSTFHLAYQHKLNIYQQAATAGTPILLDGDSLVAMPREPLSPEATARARASRARAAELAVREARHWVNVDPDAPNAHRALAQSFAAARDYAAAAGTVRRALARPAVREPDMSYELALYELVAGRPATALEALEEARRTAPYDSLVARGGSQAAQVVSASSAVALHAGRIRDAMALVEVGGRLTPDAAIFREAGFSLRHINATLVALGGVAAGMPWEQAKPLVDTTLRAVARLPQEMADMRVGFHALASLVSGDTSYLDRLPADRRAQVDSLPVYRAWRALSSGDTARAAEYAQRFSRGDTTRMRSLLEQAQEAEILAAVGDLRGALETYEAMIPRRNVGLLSLDPGWAVYGLSFARRAELRAMLGDRAGAIRDYEEFLVRWADVDPELRPQVEQARTRLAALRDAPAPRPVGPAESL